MGTTIRVGSANVGTTVEKALNIDYHLTSPAEVLVQVDRSLDILEGIAHNAGEAGCDVFVLPESTLGLMRWQRTHPDMWGEVLPEDLLFAFVVNLHVKLRDKVNADDPYLKLLLYFAFPPTSAPGKLYLESPKLELRGYE